MDLFVGRTYNFLCPVVAMLIYLYLAMRGIDSGPLFRQRNGGAFTRQQLVQQFKSALTLAGVDAARCFGHSFWVGAATTAANGAYCRQIRPGSKHGKLVVTDGPHATNSNCSVAGYAGIPRLA